jgi:hypothetical protein
LNICCKYIVGGLNTSYLNFKVVRLVRIAIRWNIGETNSHGPWELPVANWVMGNLIIRVRSETEPIQTLRLRGKRMEAGNGLDV